MFEEKKVVEFGVIVVPPIKNQLVISLLKYRIE